MGEMADELIHQQTMEWIKAEDYNSGNFFFTSPKRLKKVIWTTRDGRRLDIRDMETSHIKFSIAKCKRDKWRLEAIPYLEAELTRRTHNANN